MVHGTTQENAFGFWVNEHLLLPRPATRTHDPEPSYRV